jgi:AraC-like DNA-binding protein
MIILASISMQLSVTIFDLIVLMGFIQGIGMCIVLYLIPGKNQGKSLLSFILLIISLLSFKILLHTLGLWNTTLFRYFPLAIDTTLQPLLFLYICSITGFNIRSGRMVLFFIPTILFMLYALVVYALALSQQDFLLKDHVADAAYFNLVKSKEDWIAVFSAIAYWMIGYRIILRYRKWVFDTQSDGRLQELSWLKNVVLISGILVMAVTGIVVLDKWVGTGGHNFLYLQLFYIYLAVITYYLSFKGYQLYHDPTGLYLAAGKIRARDFLERPEPIAMGGIKSESNTEFDSIKHLIICTLETEKLYLNAELSIKELARHINVPVSSVSATINYCLQINFRHLINKYRVEEVKKRLNDPPSHLSVLGIALDCGFNSEASFYRIFRQQTGQSPNDYIQKQRN